MNRIIRLISLFFVFNGLLLPNITHAAGGTEVYVGLGVGQATLVQQSTPDETSTGYKLFGGIHVTGPFLVEVSHVNLGGYFNDTVEYSGNAIHLVGKLPFTPTVAALAKVGFVSWDKQDTATNTSTTGSDTSYGYAIIWAMPIGYTVRLEWEHYADVGKVDNNTGNDMTLLSLGISLHF